MTNAEKEELMDLHNLMYDYYAKVNLFDKKTDLERLALKIVLIGIQTIGAIIDKEEEQKNG